MEMGSTHWRIKVVEVNTRTDCNVLNDFGDHLMGLQAQVWGTIVPECVHYLNNISHYK